jgi:hypothetical protein
MDGLLIIYIVMGLLVSASWISDIYNEKKHDETKR